MSRALIAAVFLASVACHDAAAREVLAADAGRVPVFGTMRPDVGTLMVGARLGLRPQFYDSAGTPLTAAVARFTSRNPGVVRVGERGEVTATGPGETEVTAINGSVELRAMLRVVGATDRAEPVIDVFPAREYQTITGWETSAQMGEIDCHPEAYRRYRDEVIDRAVNELGLTRVRMEIRSGAESSRDPWPDFRSGRLAYRDWRATWFVAENDNDDPHRRDSTHFHWGKLDHVVEQVVQPLRAAMAARGEQLFVNLNFVDFSHGRVSKAFSHFDRPAEYAELMRATFDHMRATHGFVPDAVEMLLEPENTPHAAEAVARAIVTTTERLAEGGYRPAIIAPSTTRAANAPAFYDAMIRVPGVAGRIDEISYHRYTGISRPTLEAIARRAARDGNRTAMLEYIDAGFEEFYDDLTIANVSAWEQYTLAYCGRRTNAAARGIYFQINQAEPTAPVITVTSVTRLLRQVFLYVRPGAVRLGASSTGHAVRPLAFRNANGRHVVIGWTRGPGPFTIRGLPPGAYGINYSASSGAWNQDLPGTTIGPREQLRVEMPAEGVVTIYGR